MSATTSTRVDAASLVGAGAHTAPAVFCRVCDAEIPEKRTTAVPGVLFCLKCQESHEKKNPTIRMSADNISDKIAGALADCGERDGQQHRRGGDSYHGAVGL